MRSAGLALALALVTAVASAQSPTTIQVRAAGAVAQAGSLTVSASARLATLARAAAVRTDAYILGAAWLRPSLQSSQTRLKAGLLYDLGVMRREAAGGQPAMAELATRLRTMVDAMPVTGRKVGTTLEPHALQVTPQANLPLADGDPRQMDQGARTGGEDRLHRPMHGEKSGGEEGKRLAVYRLRDHV